MIRPLSRPALPVAFFLASLLLAQTSPAWAYRPGFRFSQGARASLRSEESIPSELVSRGEVKWAGGSWWKIFSFGEARHDIDHGHWSRMELGTEVGVKPFHRWIPPFSWFYLGNAVHQAWLDPGRDRPEWEIRTLFKIPFSWWEVKSKPVTLYALNEYTYDLREGKGSRNEMAAGVKIPLPWDRWTLLLGWRHVDFVHGPDDDQFEGSLQVDF